MGLNSLASCSFLKDKGFFKDCSSLGFGVSPRLIPYTCFRAPTFLRKQILAIKLGILKKA